MRIDLGQFRQTFLQESADHVASMEAALLELRSAPADIEILNAIFRSAHSIKGGAGSFGLTDLVRFTHSLENLLDRLRSMEIPATEQVIGLLLESVDVLESLLEAGGEGPLPTAAPGLLERIEALSSDAVPPAHQTGYDPGHDPSASGQAEPVLSGQPAAAMRRSIEFRPGLDMFSSGTNPIVLLRNLASLGKVLRCELDLDRLPSLHQLDSGQCYLGWTIELESDRPEAELLEVFEFVEHLADVRITRLAAPADATLSLASRPAILAPATEIAPHQPKRPSPAPETSPGTATRLAPVSVERRKEDRASIRVPTEKVDRLIDLVGELVIAQAMTAQMVEDFDPACLPRLREAVAAMDRNTRELHERVMGVRMLPIGTLFQRYSRTVYDISKATGKQIRLETSGEETEIDKSMLELLGDPLTHLIRNSADHGIEESAQRLRSGKPAEGTIRLRALHRSGRIVIEVSDDGAGIDPARVRAKAVERGLIPAEAQLSDEQIRLLIFEPGFSTRDQVSDLSGRGVGMDVVKRNIQQLNGTVGLASELGRGSTVTIELPLTLAILEGLLVRVADRTLVLPLLSVVETVAPAPGQIVRIAEQGEVVQIRDQSVPILRLRRFLHLADAPYPSPPDHPEIGSATPGRELVVVVETGRRKIGLVVDDLLGQQQVVMKSLERHLHKVDGLMGATILGDGCVAPILDVAAVSRLDLFALRRPAGEPIPHPSFSAAAHPLRSHPSVE